MRSDFAQRPRQFPPALTGIDNNRPRSGLRREHDAVHVAQHQGTLPTSEPDHGRCRPVRPGLVAARRARPAHHRAGADAQARRHRLRAVGAEAAPSSARLACRLPLARAPAPLVDDRGLPAGRLRRLCEACRLRHDRDRHCVLLACLAHAGDGPDRQRAQPGSRLASDGEARHCKNTAGSGRQPSPVMRDLRPRRASRERSFRLPALRRPPAFPQAGKRHARLGAGDHGAGSLPARQHLSRDDRHFLRQGRGRHDPERRQIPVSRRHVAPRAPRVLRQHYRAGPEDHGPDVPAGHHPPRQPMAAARPHTPLPHRRVGRAVVDDRHFHALEPRRARSAWLDRHHQARCRGHILRRRRRHHHVRRRRLRSPADVGCRRRKPMTETDPLAYARTKEPELKEPEIRRRRRLSPIWILPIVALLVATWLGYTAFADKGPTIAISFKTASGLEPGKTQIKYHDIELGIVQRIDPAPDLSHVVVSAQMNKTAEPHLTEGTHFWVVRPRLGLTSFSGLETLVSGNYIEMDPGPGTATERHFTGLEEPPVVRTDEPGTSYVLTTDKIGSISSGSPVFFRGIVVGEVIGYSFDGVEKSIPVRVFVKEPYDALIHDGTQFWNASGINISAGPGGRKVELESLQAVLGGGIASETPEAARVGEPAKANTSFALYDDRAAAIEAAYAERARLLVEFEGSVRGLEVGAPVEVQGIPIGKVVEFHLVVDAATKRARARPSARRSSSCATPTRGRALCSRASVRPARRPTWPSTG